MYLVIYFHFNFFTVIQNDIFVSFYLFTRQLANEEN